MRKSRSIWRNIHINEDGVQPGDAASGTWWSSSLSSPLCWKGGHRARSPRKPVAEFRQENWPSGRLSSRHPFHNPTASPFSTGGKQEVEVRDTLCGSKVSISIIQLNLDPSLSWMIKIPLDTSCFINKIDQLLKKHKLAKFTRYETDHLNSNVTIK